MFDSGPSRSEKSEDICRSDILIKTRQWLAGLKRRYISKAAITYVLTLWLGVQVCDITFPILDAPDKALVQVAAFGVLGLPVVVLLAWISELISDNIDRGSGDEEEADEV